MSDEAVGLLVSPDKLPFFFLKKKETKERESWSLNLNATITFVLTITIHHRKYWQNDKSAMWMFGIPCANFLIISIFELERTCALTMKNLIKE